MKWFKCVTEGCDDRPFTLTKEELESCEGLVNCEICDGKCLDVTTSLCYPVHYFEHWVRGERIRNCIVANKTLAEAVTELSELNEGVFKHKFTVYKFEEED